MNSLHQSSLSVLPERFNSAQVSIAVWVFTVLISLFVITERGWAQSSLIQQTLVANDGVSIEGQLISVDRYSLTFKTGSESKTLVLEDISALRFDSETLQSKPADADSSEVVGDNRQDVDQIWLVDGSVLRVADLSIQGLKIEGRLANGVDFSSARKNTRAILMEEFPDSPEKRERLGELLSTRPESSDEIVIVRKGKLETLEGVVGDLEDGKLAFTIEDQTARVSRSKVKGVLFYQAADRKLIDPLGKLTLTDGSQLLIRSMESTEAGAYSVQSVAGTTVTVASNQILELDFSLGRNVFVSDLKPTTIDWEPLMASSAVLAELRSLRVPRIDQAYNGKPLSLIVFPDPELEFVSREQTYSRGFAMAGGSRLSFALNRQYKRLSGLVGFDPSANQAGQVNLIVRADGKIVFEQEMKNDARSNPQQIDLEIADVERITFQVDYHDGRSIGDNIHLVDLQLHK